MKILIIVWLFLTGFFGLFYILETIFRSLPEGNRFKVWWNENVIMVLDPDDPRFDD